MELLPRVFLTTVPPCGHCPPEECYPAPCLTLYPSLVCSMLRRSSRRMRRKGKTGERMAPTGTQRGTSRSGRRPAGATDKSKQKEDLGRAIGISVVQNRAEHGNGEVGQVRGPFIQLEPTHHALLLEILGHPRLVDLQMLRQPRAERVITSPAPAIPLRTEQV